MTHGQRIGQLAALHPDKIAVISVAADGSRTTLTWQELERDSNRAARALLARGVAPGSTIGVAVPPDLDHVIAVTAAWKTGALVVPLNHEAGPAERAALHQALPGVIVGDGDWASVPPRWWVHDNHLDDAPIQTPGIPRSASASGGSTGKPRIVVRARPWVYQRDGLLSAWDRANGVDLGQVQLVMLPMYHAGFTGLHHGLMLDHTIVLMQRFVPHLVPDLVERFRVATFRIVPTLMRMILQVPGIGGRDFSSVVAVHHGAGACPVSVKRAWLDLVDPTAVYENYSSVERLGLVTIRGDEWLERPGW